MVRTATAPHQLRPTWYAALGRDGRRAFWAAFLGWGLDAFDFMVFPFALGAIAATFGLSAREAGAIATVTLVVSAAGGMLAGWLADRIGRVRTLILTVLVYAGCTFAAGWARTYEELLLFRALQGLGFGGEWAAGAVLVAETVRPEHRARVLGAVQSAWAIGWAAAAAAYSVIFSVLDPQLAWRVLFWIGLLPALLALYVRRAVREPELFRLSAQSRPPHGRWRALLRPPWRRTTAWAALLAVGAQGGYYSAVTWLPTYLRTTRGLGVLGTSTYTGVVIVGSFLGYVSAGYLHDRLGRRPTFALFAASSAVLLPLYALAGRGPAALVLLGLPLGFCASGIFSGFGSYLAELYPTSIRGTGQGFVYNVGRGLGALFPAAVGALAESLGLAGGLAFGAAAYGLCLVALAFLPETRGASLDRPGPAAVAPPA